VRALCERFADFMIAADEASIMIVDDSMVTIGISQAKNSVFKRRQSTWISRLSL
jgi:hypothetical protein